MSSEERWAEELSSPAMVEATTRRSLIPDSRYRILESTSNCLGSMSLLPDSYWYPVLGSMSSYERLAEELSHPAMVEATPRRSVIPDPWCQQSASSSHCAGSPALRPGLFHCPWAGSPQTNQPDAPPAASLSIRRWPALCHVA